MGERQRERSNTPSTYLTISRWFNLSPSHCTNYSTSFHYITFISFVQPHQPCAVSGRDKAGTVTRSRPPGNKITGQDVLTPGRVTESADLATSGPIGRQGVSRAGPRIGHSGDQFISHVACHITGDQARSRSNQMSPSESRDAEGHDSRHRSRRHRSQVTAWVRVQVTVHGKGDWTARPDTDSVTEW